MDEVEEMVPLYHRLAYTDFETEDLDWADIERGHLGARRLYKGLFPSGFGRFSPADCVPPKEMSKDRYPLTLQCGSIPYHFGTGTRSSRTSRLKKFCPEAFVEIGEVDAESLGISDGDKVKVISPAGEVVAGARITDTLPPGMLFMPISFPESPVNELFSIALDPRAKTPSSKACAVKLERMRKNG